MDNSNCILQIRGLHPFYSRKYDITRHPNYKLLFDYDKSNYFDVAKFVKHKNNHRAEISGYTQYTEYSVNYRKKEIKQNEKSN